MNDDDDDDHASYCNDDDETEYGTVPFSASCVINSYSIIEAHNCCKELCKKRTVRKVVFCCFIKMFNLQIRTIEA